MKTVLAWALFFTAVTANDATAWRADLHHLAVELPKAHKNAFHTMSRAEFDAAVAALDARIPSLDRSAIIVELSRLVAMVGDGHTGIADLFTSETIGFGYYPLALYLFDDGLYVYAAAPPYAAIAGGRVTEIGGRPVGDALERLRPLVPRDNEWGFRDRVAAYAVTPEVLRAVGLADETMRARFTVEKDGHSVAATIEPRHDARPRGLGRSLRVPEGWTAAATPATPPLWLRNTGDYYWLEYLPASKTLYVQFNEVANKEGEPLRQFAERVAAESAQPRVERMVLDLRWNTGGNNYLNRPLLLAIIKSKANVRGRLFTLIGRKTFSAAQNLVNDLEKYTETIFVGEPTAEHPNFYADAARIVLPNSKITVYASALWWQDLDSRDRRTATGPHIATDLRWDDYAHGADPALDAALQWRPPPALAEQIDEALRAGNAARAHELAEAWRANRANRYATVESPLNSLGYRLLQGGRVADAVEVFRINVELYPESANVYDSLGEAYLAAGNKTLSDEAYRKAAALAAARSR
ncbi:MAG TPA: hypothetical protein VJZ76_18335 [Thermoanaerobaculia bacterium]|nr:hypothetical protein [Thermoanaerobaculia bacterium]